VTGGYYAGLGMQPAWDARSLTRMTSPPQRLWSYSAISFGRSGSARTRRHRPTAHTQQTIIHHHRRHAARLHRHVHRWMITPSSPFRLPASRCCWVSAATWARRPARPLVDEFDGTAQTGRDLRTGARQLERRISGSRAGSHAAPRKANEPAQLEPKDYPRLLAESGSRGMLDKRRYYSTTSTVCSSSSRWCC
jgi:hypothetical protein